MIKRLDYAYFAIELFFIAYEQAAREGVTLIKDGPISDWCFYMANFEQKSNVLTPQFFYDFARCALTNF